MKRSQSQVRRVSAHCLAEAAAHHLNQQLQHLIQVIQQLTVARDLETIMAAVRTAARQLTGADGATFVLRDRDQCYYADEDAISPLWKGGRFPMDACISGWVMLNQQAVIIEDIYADPRIPAAAYRPTFVKSLAMVPIRTRDPIGAIGNYWATHHAPTADEMKLLQTLADAAAVALENAQLYEEQEQRIQDRTAQLQQALDFEALLKRITDKVRDSLDEHQILATVVQELMQGLAVSHCDTTLYNASLDQQNQNNLHQNHAEQSVPLGQAVTIACYGVNHTEVVTPAERAVPLELSPDLYGQLLRGETCQCHYTSPLWEQPAIVPVPLPVTDATMLILVCPIIDNQNLLGDMRLYRASGEPFADVEVRLVQQVANQCAIALRQSTLYQTAQAQVRELERLNQLKDDFLSTVSHELRTPISNMRMATQMLEISLNRLGVLVDATPPINRYFKVLREEGQREMHLINDLLDLTRLEPEIDSLRLTKVDIQLCISHLIESFVERTCSLQQQIVMQIAPDLPPLITDAMCLERILTELLHNACKYTPHGETITFSSQIKSTVMEIRVSNSGIEIPSTEYDRVFDKFYRIPHQDPWKHRGTGLGLTLVKKLTERLGGSIGVESGNGQTTFILKFALSQNFLATGK